MLAVGNIYHIFLKASQYQLSYSFRQQTVSVAANPSGFTGDRSKTAIQ